MSVRARARRGVARFAALWAVAGGWAYHSWRFYRHSGLITRGWQPDAQLAHITKLYHMIEKGLALPEPRPGFGIWAVTGLCVQLGRALDAGRRDPELQLAVDALAGYAAFNERHGAVTTPAVGRVLARAAAAGLMPAGTPTAAHRRHAPIPDLMDGILSRHSVRQFADGPVPDEVLRAAARAAQAAPCVCNRQASRVYFVRDDALKAALLACQNGNRGFGDTAAVIGIVTTSLSHFLEPSEHYQPWIDGGLFTMNLLLGVHAQGYGACCLNWSALPPQDRALRRLGIIAPAETVITMLAIGPLRDDYVAARSGRPPVDTIMRLL
jgi:nitroreductase